MDLKIHPEVADALQRNQPVLALESTLLAHGMPAPQNREFAYQTADVCHAVGITPATMAIIEGKIHIGLTEKNLLRLTDPERSTVRKLATRDLASAIAQGDTGATTVSATMTLAQRAGIQVFATGGIGGVHRNVNHSCDISQDLTELSRTPMIVISAGCKAILDIPKTLEYMETLAIPVVGYQTGDFPAFYSRTSGYAVTETVESPEAVAERFRVQQELNLPAALVVANPVPEAAEIPRGNIEEIIAAAIQTADDQGLSGAALTPFLLQEIVKATQGKSLETNMALALNNVRLGAEIAVALTRQ